MENMNKSFIIRNKNVIGMDVQRVYTSTPVGIIQPFASNTNIPRGYLLCDGTSYKVADYPDLYAVIGNTYGGDTENFNVPDYRETVLVGVGENTTDTIASHDVYELGEFKDDQLQEHKHDVSGVGYGASSGANWQYSTRQPKGDEYSDNVVTTSNNISRTGSTTHGKQKGVTYIIKAFHTNEGVDSGVSDDVINYVKNSNSYSTEETLTGGKWIDGKPIYRKVIIYTLSNALTGLVTIPHDIQNIGTPIRIVCGNISNPDIEDGGVVIPAQYSSSIFVQLGAFSSTYVQLYCGSSSWTEKRKVKLCLEYTKTTD